jgi:hypothetical protein
VGSTGVQIDWVPNPTVTGYAVEQVDRATAGAGATPVVVAEQEVDGALARFSWNDLEPATRYCLQLRAVNGAGTGVPSAPQCTETAPQAPIGPPTGLTVTPIEGRPLSVELAWTPSAPDTDHLVLVDDQVTVSTSAASTTLDVPAGTHCFAVLARTTAGEDTPPSTQVCLPLVGPPPEEPTPTTGGSAVPTVPGTTAGSGPGGPTTAGGGGPGTTAGGTPTTGAAPPPTPTTVVAPVPVDPGWIAIVDSFAAEDYVATDPLARAQARRGELEAAGIAVDLAPSESLRLEGQRAWVIYADGFDDQAGAAAVCRAVQAAALARQSCLTFDRTSPPRPGATTTTSTGGATPTTGAAGS